MYIYTTLDIQFGLVYSYPSKEVAEAKLKAGKIGSYIEACEYEADVKFLVFEKNPIREDMVGVFSDYQKAKEFVEKQPPEWECEYRIEGFVVDEPDNLFFVE